MKKITQQFKITFYFFVFSLGLIITFILIDLSFFSNELEKTAMSNAMKKIEEKETKLSHFFDTSKSILKSTGNSSYFNRYLKDTSLYHSELSDIFLSIVQINKNIMQFRYIDKDGYEKVRVDRFAQNSSAKIVSNTLLQNKSNRYYFNDSKNKINKVWFSNLDLNMEQGKVIKPYVPTLRAILPLYKNDVFQGILIINYFMQDLLNELSELSFYDMILLNEKGDILSHYDKSKNWSFYRNDKYNIANEFPSSYKLILSSSLVIKDKFVSKSLPFQTSQKLILLAQFKKEYLANNKKNKLAEYYTISSIIVLLSFLMSYIFSKYFNRIFFILKYTEKKNKSLGMKVDEKTKELQELNESLEHRIKEEIAKNKDKDERLFAQAKHVAMGEMLANIAHQWRQPLSLISTNASGVKLRYLYKQLDYKELPEHMDVIIDRTQYLSNIIETFRNFLTEEKEYKKTILQDSVNSALNITSGSLKDNFIKIQNKIDDRRPVVLNTISSELTEVLINIITNAKDVLIHRQVKLANIIIDLEVKENKVLISVEDNAGGIPKENLSRVFEPYFTTKHKAQGTGLGLHMSYKIVTESLNGSLHARNINDGAKFFIELPIK